MVQLFFSLQMNNSNVSARLRELSNFSENRNSCGDAVKRLILLYNNISYKQISLEQDVGIPQGIPTYMEVRIGGVRVINNRRVCPRTENYSQVVLHTHTECPHDDRNKAFRFCTL